MREEILLLVRTGLSAAPASGEKAMAETPVAVKPKQVSVHAVTQAPSSAEFCFCGPGAW